uniref:Uncharacterized protein n=1 Tax=Anguilla anguilla TaxID=7936 RepID=A0A0E9UQG7_ANGAN
MKAKVKSTKGIENNTAMCF